MMTMRQIASGDGDDGEGRDQDHGHDERGVINAQDPIHPTRRRRNRERKDTANRCIDGRSSKRERIRQAVIQSVMD